MAVAYDLVLEDHILARQGVKKRQRPFARELAEMVRYAVGYRSRAFVTFGAPIPLDGFDPESRRDVLDARAIDTRDAIGRALQGAADGGLRRRACGRRSRAASSRRASTASSRRCGRGAPTSASTRRRQAIDEAAEPLEARGIIVVERGGRFRVRERSVLRYYARTIEHLLVPRRVPRTH